MTLRKTSRIAVTLSVLLAVVAAPARAQDATSLSGTVVDASGAIIPGAAVIAKNVATGTTFEAVTDERGSFTIPSMRAATYTVSVTLSGFKTVVVKNVKLEVGVPATVNATLQVGQMEEAVTVTGGTEIVQTQTSTVSTTLARQSDRTSPVGQPQRHGLRRVHPRRHVHWRQSRFDVQRPPPELDQHHLRRHQHPGQQCQDRRRLPDRHQAVSWTRSRKLRSRRRRPMPRAPAMAPFTSCIAAALARTHSRGSVYQYLRNPILNANYWFNNRDLPPDPRTGKAPKDIGQVEYLRLPCGRPDHDPWPVQRPRQGLLLFQRRAALGCRRASCRQRTLLNPLSQQGFFQYTVAGADSAGRSLRPGASQRPHLHSRSDRSPNLLDDIRNGDVGRGWPASSSSDPNLISLRFAAPATTTGRYRWAGSMST